LTIYSRWRRLIRPSGFIGSSGIYLFGSVANSLLPLALVPIFTRYLTPEDYGLNATALILMNFFVIGQGLNSYGLVTRNYFDQDSLGLVGLVSTTVWYAVVSSIVLLLCLPLGLGSLIARVSEFPSEWLWAVVVLGLFMVLQNTYRVLLQARREPWHFVFNQTLVTIVSSGVGLWLVVGQGWDWRGRLIGLLLGGCIVSFACLYGLKFRLRLLTFSFSAKYFRAILHFGVPLIPHILGGWVMTMSSRIFLNKMASVADAGFFSLAFSLVAPLIMLIGSVQKTYQPWLFQKLANPGSFDPLKLCRSLIIACCLIMLGGVGFGVLGVLVLPYIAGPNFVLAGPYIFWLSLATAFSGVYFVFGSFVIFSKRTSLMAWRADFLGGLVVLVACPLMILAIGPIGAAIANCLGFAATTIGCISAARIAYPMPWGKALKSFVWWSRRDR